MPSFALRIDGEFDKVKDWVDRNGYGGFAVRETVAGENEHWHWLLETDKELHSVRCSFNRAVPELKGNGKYSLTLVNDVDKYERYLAKGDSEGQVPEIAWTHSIKYDAEKLEELHEAYWSENRKLRKRKAGSMVDWVIDAAKAAEVRWQDRDKLSRLYIRELGARGKPINLFSIRANLNTVQLALCPDDTILDQLVEKVEQY